ncbi:MAG TPA: hypothetical protein VG758_23640 [Hyphomicrobiaceae bacterium]|nr:hypothetical protein [Hyphomicrobiaceae bacterium]
MNNFTPADEMHRLAKRSMDNGTVASRQEAEGLLRGYRITLSMGPDEAADRHHQAALLTAVELARRVFLGGVTVEGYLDVPLTVPLPSGPTLLEAVVAAGGTNGAAHAGTPLISIGGSARRKTDRFSIRAVFDGWRGGIVPGHAEGPDRGRIGPMALSPMLAAALAINEAFLHVSGESQSAGKRSTGLDLWNLARSADWMSSDESAPALRYLPSNLWLIGLGHLGQAYLWGLGLLPYAIDAKVGLVLQDVDVITPSTESTSILSDKTMLGHKKTRVTAAWAERRGFDTAITERLFDETCRLHRNEPPIALCGLDNAAGRRALDQVGFEFVVEAGLGRGHQDFRSLLIHTLPGETPASTLWKEGEANQAAVDAAAYRKMLDEGSLDRCGVTLLAGKAVGAPFVGAVAATLVLGEVLRLLHGGGLHRLVDVNLVDLAYFRAVPQLRDFSSFNPGFVAAEI